MWCKVMQIPTVKDRVLYVLVLIMVFPCLGLGLLERESQIESLVGVEGVQVVINIGLSQEGPTKQGLQEQIERQIREGGLQVLKPLREDSEFYQSTLLLEVAIWKGENKPYIYFIYANLFQPVRLLGSDSSDTLGATWQAGLVGEGGIDGIREDVSKVVKGFLFHHKKINRERSHTASE